MEKKVCKTCGAEKAISHFRVAYYYKGNPIIRSSCNSCVSVYNMTHYERKKYQQFENRKKTVQNAIQKWKSKNPSYFKNRREILLDDIVTQNFERDGLSEFKENKEFIELKRRLIILNRTIRKFSKQKSNK